MKIIGYIIGACLVLAIVRAMAVAFVIMLLVAIVIGAFTKPRETFGLLAFLVLTSVIENYGALVVVAVAALVAIGMVVRAFKGAEPPGA